MRQRGQDIAERLGLKAGPSPVPGLDDLLAEAIYAGIWGRPELALADRAICALSALSSLQRLASLKPMVATALEVGLTPRNIVEVFVQVGFMRVLSRPTNLPWSRRRFSKLAG
jgi:alkylhydroperoxidase/carboxymuconolactone decarboxylase family protein YurZ